MKYDNQLRYAVNIIESFNGNGPLHNWLKDFFRENKQMGSRDRKQTSEMVYCFYRLGHAAKALSTGERILTGLFLCNHSSNEILQYFKPSWNEMIAAEVNKKIAVISSDLGVPEKIFPFSNELSPGIDHAAFSLSFLWQPDLFIRIRPGFEKSVKEKLERHSIAYHEIDASCLACSNATKLDEVLDINREAVIQDMNSQRTGAFFGNMNEPSGQKINAWDCCAASGGKSMMLFDQHPLVDLTVSDIRESILANLKKRFSEAGIQKYKMFVVDLSIPDFAIPIPKSSFDLIIADVPCTGSGTWSRNPDALYFFDESVIDRYQAKQKMILSRVIPFLKKNGRLVYITCSVFRKENEEMIEYILQNSPLHKEESSVLAGYSKRADSMFVASFIA